MASTQLEKSRLRDLILAFYTENDPIRLQDGIDISGMVNWTMNNGIEALNFMLNDKYGKSIDINDKTEINNVQQINRISMAVSGRQVMNFEEMRKVRIAEKLKQFYKMHDRSKLPAIFKLTEFALYKGENALNSKLMMKYGADLRSFDENESVHGSVDTDDIISADGDPVEHPVIPEVIPGQEQSLVDSLAPHVKTAEEIPESPVVVIKRFPSIEELDLLEPEDTAVVVPSPTIQEVELPKESTTPVEKEEIATPSPPDKTDSKEKVKIVVDDIEEPENVDTTGEIIGSLEEDREYLQAELTRFYKVHDPDKIIVLDALVLWALQLGRKGYNGKLMQLYGVDLDSPIEDPKKKEKVIIVPQVSTSRITRINKPIRTEKNLLSQIIGTQKRSFISFEQAAKAETKRANPLEGPKLFREHMIPDGEQCDNYRIDMTSPLFGICVCGFPKRAHN